MPVLHTGVRRCHGHDLPGGHIHRCTELCTVRDCCAVIHDDPVEGLYCTAHGVDFVGCEGQPDGSVVAQCLATCGARRLVNRAEVGVQPMDRYFDRKAAVARALEVDCPACGRVAAYRCVDRYGHLTSFVHVGRHEAIGQAASVVDVYAMDDDSVPA